MKTTIAVILTWFTVVGLVAFGACYPETLDALGTTSVSGHGVVGMVKTWHSVAILAGIFGGAGVTVLISYLHFVESKAKARA